jgi:hypothetical protein
MQEFLQVTTAGSDETVDPRIVQILDAQFRVCLPKFSHVDVDKTVRMKQTPS